MSITSKIKDCVRRMFLNGFNSKAKQKNEKVVSKDDICTYVNDMCAGVEIIKHNVNVLDDLLKKVENSRYGKY